MTHTPLCTVKGCPHPSDDSWHRCFVCGKAEGDHQHFPKKSLAGKGAKIVAFLCRNHHEKITLHQWREGLLAHPDGSKRYYVQNEKGEQQCERIIEAAPEDEGQASRSVQRRIAAQKGQPAPRFESPDEPHEALTDVTDSEALPAVKEDIQYHPTNLALPENLSFERWEQVGGTLWDMHKAWQWWFADWWDYGERTYGELASQAIAADAKYQTLANVLWVGRRFEVSRRRESLPFTHHSEVAALEPAQQDELLDRAEAEHLSARELRQLIKGEKPPEACPHYGDSGHRFQCECGKER